MVTLPHAKPRLHRGKSSVKDAPSIQIVGRKGSLTFPKLGLQYKFRDGPRDISSTFVHIQYLRGLAAIFVVYFHTSVYNPHFAWSLDRSFGYGGVDIFFAISGFIMTVTNFARPLTPARFLFNRALRIYPPYWVATTISIALFLLVPSAFIKDTIDLPYVLYSYALLPLDNASGTSHGVPFLRIGWTLIFEMYFYLVFAASLLIRHRPFVRFALQATCILALVGVGAAFHPTSAPMGFLINPLAIEFLLGCAAGLLTGAGLLRAPRTVYILVVLVCLVLLFMVSSRTGHDWRVLGFGLPAVGLVLCAALYERFFGTLFRSPFLFLLGDASYSIYLFHPFALTGVRVMSQHLPFDFAQPIFGAIGIVFSVLAAVVLGLIMFLLVERPILRWTRRMTERSTGTPNHEGPGPMATRAYRPMPTEGTASR